MDTSKYHTYENAYGGAAHADTFSNIKSLDKSHTNPPVVLMTDGRGLLLAEPKPPVTAPAQLHDLQLSYPRPKKR